MKHQYEPIPETEDVTPVGKSLTSKSKRPLKYLCSGIFIVLLIAALIYLGLRYASASNRKVKIFQTSYSDSRVMRELKSDDLEKLEKYPNALAFGNSLESCDGKDCSLGGSPFSSVTVNPDKKHQKIVGFGGAFTEATAYNYNKLSPKVQKKVIDAYFGPKGIRLTLGRISINSCDFGIDSYNFDDINGDYALQYFDTEVTHDNAFIIPLIQTAMDASVDPIRLVASPWSPPSWMKNPIKGNYSMLGSAEPNGLKDDPVIKRTWANYIAKWITAYDYKGVPIWAVTPQNEPEFAAPWEACKYTAEYENDFINNYLGPVLRAIHPDVKILGFDHNKDHLLTWAHTLIGGDTGDYIDGMAFHWYGGLDRMTDGTYGYDALNSTHHYAPNKLLISTEGCSCPGVKKDDWLRAERLGHDLLFDLRNYANGWIDWNLLVNSKGGPNHLGNICDASIYTLEDYSDIHFQPKFYYMAHFSKFVLPGSVRVESSAVGQFDFVETDPNVQAGLEVGMYACEESSRQQWIIRKNKLQLRTKAAQDLSDPDGGKQVFLCVAPGEETGRQNLRLANCEDDITFLEVSMNDDGQIFDKNSGFCVSVAGDVREPGAVLQLNPCKTTKKHEKVADEQHFKIIEETGEIITPSINENLCLTAGWPFLNVVAFRNEKIKETVVVLINDGTIPTVVAMFDHSKGKQLHFPIEARSIETIIY